MEDGHRYFTIPNFSHKYFSDDTADLNLEDGIMAVVAMLTGILSVFLGYRFYRITFFIAGIYFGYIVMFATLYHSGANLSELALFCICAAVGLVAGAVLAFFWRAGLFAVGALAGFVFASYFLGFLNSTRYDLVDHPWDYIVTTVCCLAFGLATFFCKRIFLVVSTSFLGAYYFIYSIDVFMSGKTGFAATFDGIMSGDNSRPHFTKAIWGMLVGAAVLCLIGVLVQYFITSKGVSLPGENKSSSSKKLSKKSRDSIIKDLEMRLAKPKK